VRFELATTLTIDRRLEGGLTPKAIYFYTGTCMYFQARDPMDDDYRFDIKTAKIYKKSRASSRQKCHQKNKNKA